MAHPVHHFLKRKFTELAMKNHGQGTFFFFGLIDIVQISKVSLEKDVRRTLPQLCDE